MTALSRFARGAARPPVVAASGCEAGARLASPFGRRRGEVCLALSVLAVAAGAGCLIPQDVDQTKVNLPPRIVIELLPTSYTAPFLTLTRAPRDVGCTCELLLSIPTVAEDDPTITLLGRWFIDYDLRVPSSQRTAEESVLPGTFDFTKIRRNGPSFTVGPDTVGGDGFHTVDVVIGDQKAFVSGDPPPVLPNRTLKDGFEAAVYRFVIKVVTDPDLPRCPETPPLARSCNP